MATTHITLSDDALLGEYVRLDDFKRLLEQRVAVGPDLLAMLIKDGQIAQAAPGGHFAVGGVWRTIKDAVAGAHAIRLLVADLKPFPVSKTIPALTKDAVEILCELTIELQVNPERPANVLGLMKDHAAVTKAGVLTRLAPQHRTAGQATGRRHGRSGANRRRRGPARARRHGRLRHQ
jgi:hypothetical protein